MIGIVLDRQPVDGYIHGFAMPATGSRTPLALHAAAGVDLKVKQNGQIKRSAACSM